MPFLACAALVAASLAVQGGQVRWIHDPQFQAERWLPQSVALGDHGAAAMAGAAVDDASFHCYSAGSATPAFSTRRDTVLRHYVAIAEEAPLAAVLAVQPKTGSTRIEAVVEAYLDHGDGTPAWTVTLPSSLYWGGGGVAVDRAGDTIVAFWTAATRTSNTTHIRAWRPDGTLIAAGTTSDSTSFSSRVRLSADGTRALLSVGGAAVVWDVVNGVEEARFYQASIFDSMALSADGQRVAVATWLGGTEVFEVHERDASGAWNLLVRIDPAPERPAAVALDADGDRLAWQVFNNAGDRFMVGLHDVDADLPLWEVDHYYPGSTARCDPAGIDIDDAGETIGSVNWGDDAETLPEVHLYDGAGNLLIAVDTTGSATDIDVSADGALAIASNKATHATTFGAGGQVTLIETRKQEFHVLGRAGLDDTLDFTIDAAVPGELCFLPASLGLVGSGDDALRVDFAQLYALFGPFVVPAGGLAFQEQIPNDPALAGVQVHLQAIRMGIAPGLRFTNKVSVRVIG